MQLGMIGLGRMGANMTQRLLDGGHSLVVYDRSAEAVQRMTNRGAVGVSSLGEMAQSLEPPRAIWIMVPSGAPTEQTIEEILPYLQPDDILIDGGNSNFKDSKRRLLVPVTGIASPCG